MNRRVGGVIAAVVVLLVVGVGALVGRSLWQQHKRDIIERGLVKMLPGVSQRIQNFRRVKMEDGRKVWEVSADDARYMEDQSMIVVHKPVVAWFLHDGREVGLRGEDGRIHLDEHDLRRVEVEGPILVSLADYQLRTTGAVYDHSDGLITSSSDVEITGKAMDLRGQGMEVDIEGQRLRVLHNVSMRLEPGELQQGG